MNWLITNSKNKSSNQSSGLCFGSRGIRIIIYLSAIFTCLISCTQRDETFEASFHSQFEQYIDEQKRRFSSCQTIDCYTNLNFPVFVSDSITKELVWNDAAMSIDAQAFSSLRTYEQDEDIYLVYRHNNALALIPLSLSDLNAELYFGSTLLSDDFSYTHYDVLLDSNHKNGWRLQNVNKQKPPGNRSIIFLFALIAALFISTLKVSDQLLNYFGVWAGSLIVILLLSAIRLSFNIPGISNFFTHHEIFQHHLGSSILSPSLGELFINMLLFFTISIFLFKSFDGRPIKNYTLIRRWSLLISGYLLVMMSIISFVYVVKRIVIHSSISFQFDKIYILDWNTHVFIVSILLFICSLFFLSYLLIKILSKTGARLGQRLLAFFIAILLTFFIFITFSLHISAFGFYIFVLSILILMDLFVESKQKSISWLVLWLVTIASGTTALIYAHNTIAYRQKAAKFSKEVANAYVSGGFQSAVNIENPEGYQWSIHESGRIRHQVGGTIQTTISDEVIPELGKLRLQNVQARRISYYRHSPGIIISTSTNQDRLIQFISLFSFLFTSLTIIVLGIFLINILFHFIPAHWNVKFVHGQSIRRRIQYVIFGMLILSFATVFAVTSFYLRDFKNQDNTISREALRIGLEFFENQNLSLSRTINSPTRTTEFPLQFAIYNTSGKRLSSTPDCIFYRPPHTLVLDDRALDEVHHSSLPNWSGLFRRSRIEGQDLIVGVMQQNVRAGDNYLVNNLLGTLLNLYIFLFVVASSIALTFSDSITRPLLKLREKFSSVKIGRSNEPIDWDSNDELGQLIADYNRMITKIEESVNTLTMTERELAWREMAKQVAHEIKNPLTPMKLSLQHLQHAIKKNPSGAQELIDRVSKTLLEQIDNLSSIASEFSHFAKMPKPKNKKVVLNDVASSVHDLFRKREDMDINLYIPIDEIYVFGDHHYMTRVLINLLKNATQAIPNYRRGIIDIHVYKEMENAVIKVKDNGVGIPAEIRDKVFQPNFTSKNSGTGLGLAICANIVESFNGKIYFETNEQVGTTFFIEIPLMRMEDNFKEEKHVIL